MRTDVFEKAILKYLHTTNNTDWVINEAHKFEFVNYLQNNVNFHNQSNEDILKILIHSQTISYDGSRGIQFIQKSGKDSLSTFIQLKDVQLFREFKSSDFDRIDWSDTSMSYTGLSAWLSALFPEKFYPVPAKGFNETINYLFQTDYDKFPKIGAKYITECQSYLHKTENELKKYPVEEVNLNVWNKYFKANPSLGIEQKKSFSKVDWNWITQDFHIFIYRNILKLYKPKDNSSSVEIAEEFEPTGLEGQSKLTSHIRYERNSGLIRKIKQRALKSNPMLNCEVCNFSFYERYGELGKGFIEAHHLSPLNLTTERKTTVKDIALLCSNCHKMIHRGIFQFGYNKLMDVEELKELLIKKQNSFTSKNSSE